MGLLDFFQNGSNNNAQGDNTNPPAVPDFASIQQSYTNQSLANVSYPMAPMASSNPYAPAPSAVAPQTAMPAPQVQPMPAEQPMVPMPVTPVNNFVAENTPMPESTPVENNMMPSPAVPDITQPEEKDVPSYEYVDPSKHPVIPTVVPNQGHTQTMPEGIKVTTFEPVTTPEVQPENSSLAPEAPAEVNTEAAPEVPSMEPPVTEPQPEINTVPPIDQMNQPIQNSMPEIPAMDSMQEMPVDQNQMNANSTIPSDWNPVPNPELPAMPSVQDVMPQEQPAMNAVTPDIMQNNVLPVEQPVEVQTEQSAEQVQPQNEQPAPAPEAPSEDLGGLEIGVGSETVDINSVPEIPEMTPEVPVEMPTDSSTNMETMPEVEAPAEVSGPEVQTTQAENEQTIEVAPPVAPVAEAAVESAPVAAPVEFEMSYFKTIGFVGLNTTQTNLKVVEKITDLSAKLAEHAEVFILDSAKGYAKSVFDSAKDHQIELMGMYLKPFHSGYSDEAELGDYDNFTVMMFSNSGDKIKNLLKESDLLIMPEVTGLNNLGTLFDIWATSSMYPGQNKPLLLIGKGWTNILVQLKSLFKLSDSDLSFVTVCQTTEEALAKITELDRSFVTREVKQPKKVIDLREEDDEEGLFI